MKAKRTWAQIIANAKKRKRQRFTPNEWQMASTFASCAVAEVAPAIANSFRLNGTGGQITRARQDLHNLGCDFFHAVSRNDFNSATRLLSEIRKAAQACQ